MASSSKEQVKSILQQNKKTFLSGEEIADRLGLSRNAVWKAVKSLRAEGYAIDAETRRGYCLVAEPDLLDEEKIRKCLEDTWSEVLKDEKDQKNGEVKETFLNLTEKEKTSFISKENKSSPVLTSPSSFHIKVYPEIDSTNQEGKRLAIAGAESGTVILADQQTAGRGRRSNAFASPAGGLYFSLLLRPDGEKPVLSTTDPKEIMTRSLEAACACVDRVTGKKISYEANDLYLDGRKVGGILTESGYEFESGLLQWVVIGVGLNVKTDLSQLPEETRMRAGSLYPAEDDHSLKNELAAGLIVEFARRLIL
ncbi:MAG: biotin--[acetyl-CoA-carboxylase] ligase [Lachnospiraceae bacterium]|nr:biotin--[acetyl-CoA-carboxylase] ligase [Lachnospiraceae bacterium]